MTPIAMDVDPAPAAAAPAKSSAAPTPLFGAIALAAAFGVELMIIAFAAWGRITRTINRHEFTVRAWNMMHPERDLPIYVAGIAITLSLITFFCWGWTWMARRSGGRRSSSTVAAVQVALAIGGLITFLAFLDVLLPLDARGNRAVMHAPAGFALAAVGILTIALAALDARFSFADRIRYGLMWAGPILMVLSIRMQLLLAPAAVELEMLLLLAVLWYWLRMRRQEDEANWKSHALRRSAILAGMAMGTFAISLTMLPPTQSVPSGSFLHDTLNERTRIPVFAMMICLLLDLHWASKPARINGRWLNVVCDIVFPVLLVATLWVPPSQWTLLTGSFLGNDELHHWNFFVLGPALAVSHGRALITDVYSQYGVGWPYLFAMLRHAVKLSYANLLGCSILYGCVYFVALYFFLRWLMRDPIWAACGAILAVTLQIFSGSEGDDIIWNYPSSTMLRHPMDVWLFLAVTAHARWGGKKWMTLAGAICGLAVLFELDTGIELLLALGFYWLLDQFRKSSWRGFAKREAWLDLLFAGAASATVWLVGMALASRGTILRGAFWKAYFEGLNNQAFSGLGLLPISNVGGYGMAIFAGMLLIYFFAIGLAGARIWQHTATEIDLFLASISAYGFGLLLLFVGRSHPLNLFHPMVPLAIVIALLLYSFRTTVCGDLRWTSFPWVLAVAALAMLWTKPEFAIYPSPVAMALIGSPGEAGPLKMSAGDLGGMPLSLRDEVNNTLLAVKALKTLPVRDRDIAVLDDRDTLLCYLSDRSPWSRYGSIFHSLLTGTLIAQTEAELLAHPPRYIVMRHAPSTSPQWDFEDTWTAFHRFVPKHYQFEKTVGIYDLWRRK